MGGLIVVVLVLVFASFVLAFQGMFMYVTLKREQQEKRLRSRLGVRNEEEDAIIRLEEEAAAAASGITRTEAVDAATAALGVYGEAMQMTILAAGSDITVTKLVSNMAVVGVGTMIAMFFLIGPMCIITLPIGTYIPYLLLQRQANARAAALLSQMPDTLELMSRAMQTGTGLSEAFRLASEEMPEPINIEFGRIYEEIRFGKDWRIVLNGLVDRNPTIFDLRLFVSTLLLQRDTGGNMIETLTNIAKTIRGRYVFDAKVKAMTSEARASGFVLAGMPLGVILLILIASPYYLKPLYETNLGNMVVLFCMCLYGFGLYIMKITAQVEV